MASPDPKKWNFSGPKLPDSDSDGPGEFPLWEGTKAKKKERVEKQEVAEPSEIKFEPQVTATSTIPDSDLGLWWKTLMGFVTEKSVTDILFSPESYEVFCRMGTQLKLYQCVGKENYDRLIYNRMTQDRENTGGKHDLIVAKKTEELQEKGETDFAVTTFGRRMRVNVYKSLKGLAAAFRPLPNKSIPWRDNGLSEAIMKVVDTTKQGLVLITGPTGSGKSLGKGTPVIKFDGSIAQVENLVPGDVLMGPDSKPRVILQTHKGKGPCYEIRPTKGEPWICNDVHIMTLKRSVKGQKYKKDGYKRNDGEYQAFGKTFPSAKNKFRTEPPAEIVDVELKGFLDRSPKKTPNGQYWKLFKVGVDFPVDKEIESIHKDIFYFLGLWVGDGTKTCLEITNADKPILNWLESFATKYNLTHTLKDIKTSRNTKRFKIRCGQEGHIVLPSGPSTLERLVLDFTIPKNQNKRSLNSTISKTIPKWAITATKEQRLSLLAGIIDSDGYCDGKCFTITMGNKNLIENIKFLAGSLGLACYLNKEKKVKGTSYYQVSISGDAHTIPTVIPRKKSGIRKQKKDPMVVGWQAHEIGENDYYGFVLNGDGRFLLGDFTVTHNSTTLCSMLEYVNEKYPYHVITIEDPIEYIFTNKRCVIDQREVEEHTNTFQSALRASLRENPDIIFVGELRDYETARTALMAADTGHLVFATLHTRRVYSTISRLLEMAPESSRSEMRAMISNALSMVICQRLLAKRGGGIYPCREVMMLNPAISSLIKEGKEKGISSQLTINQSRGMLEWGRALELAVEAGYIAKDEAEKYRDSTEDID